MFKYKLDYMIQLEKNFIDSIKHKIPIDNIKFLSFNNKNIENNSNYYILKPKGKKSFVWFTYFEKEILCILIILNDNNVLHDSNLYYKLDVNYNIQLCYNNTFMQCILIKNNSMNTIIIDNILNYNIHNNIINNNTYLHKIESKLFLYNIVIKQISNSKTNKFYLPIIENNLDSLYNKIYNTNYNLYCISIYSKTKYLGNFIFNDSITFTSNIKANFYIEPNIEQDIYSMYIIDINSNYIFYDHLLINSYKLSVFMNNIFRKIKENKNLDLLEESDLEDEFQDISKDKFVNINKKEIIECVYNYKFKKWIPEKIVSQGKVINKQELLILLNKKFNNNNNFNNNNFNNNNFKKKNYSRHNYKKN